MAPVRGIVWVVKLPFVLVWMLLHYIGSCLYAAVAAAIRWGESERERERERERKKENIAQPRKFTPHTFYRIPAHYLGRIGTRLKLMWTWARTSANKVRLCLPFSSSYSECTLTIWYSLVQLSLCFSQMCLCVLSVCVLFPWPYTVHAWPRMIDSPYASYDGHIYMYSSQYACMIDMILVYTMHAPADLVYMSELELFITVCLLTIITVLPKEVCDVYKLMLLDTSSIKCVVIRRKVDLMCIAYYSIFECDGNKSVRSHI